MAAPHHFGVMNWIAITTMVESEADRQWYPFASCCAPFTLATRAALDDLEDLSHRFLRLLVSCGSSVHGNCLLQFRLHFVAGAPVNCQSVCLLKVLYSCRRKWTECFRARATRLAQ